MSGKFHRKESTEPAWAKEFESILQAYQQSGGNPENLKMSDSAVLVISTNRVIMKKEIPGISFEAEELQDGVRALIKVEHGKHIQKPVHLCFGMIPQEGIQNIIARYEIGNDASVEFLAHCTFPNAINLKHIMNAEIFVGNKAKMIYRESHFHGNYGGIEVFSEAKVIVKNSGEFLTTFNLVHGRVGKLVIDYEVDVNENGIAELVTKAYGHADDKLRITESLHLNGASARGLTKTRIAVRDNALSEVYTTTEGNAPGTRGHMDCTEIVAGKALAVNVPKVSVKDEHARVTHEAAIGSVNNKELETLMARGLEEETAIDIIIRGMLK